MKAKVIVDPSFRTMDEIFDADARRRLESIADVVWGRDEPMPTEAFRRELANADAVVFAQWRHGAIDPVTDAPALRAALEVAGGHHHPGIDYDACLANGIRIGSCAPAFVPAVAEMGLALALASIRGVASSDRAMRNRQEQWLHDGNEHNSSLIGATVGFVGCGGIATQLRKMLASFDVTALGFDPPIGPTGLRARGFEPHSLTDIFDRSRAIFVLAAPTAANEELINAELIEMLGPDQHIVVLSRASVIHFDALVAHVTAGRTNAAIDVFPNEPVGAGHPVRDAEHAVMTPHLAGALADTLLRIGTSVVNDLERVLAGDRPNELQYLEASNAQALIQPAAQVTVEASEPSHSIATPQE